MTIQANERGGFTIIELMIVVGIIGILAAIAIPNFITYQAHSRRSEAFANLAAVARAQTTYLAETGAFFEAAPFPDFSGPGLGTQKMGWDAASDAAYADLGWKPDGNVFYSYENNTGATACTCTLCFTASAFGDVDGDGLPSAIMYVHPSVDIDGAVTGECPAGLFGFGTPVRPEDGQPIYDSVAIQRTTDEY